MEKKEIISKLRNGEERYAKNNLVRKSADCLIHGVHPVTVIDDLIDIIDNLQGQLQEIYKNGKQVIIKI